MSFPFDPEEGLIVVPTLLYCGPRDVLVQLALDTGATGTMIGWDAIVLLGYDPSVTNERIKVTTGSGVEFVPRIELEKIEALGQACVNFSVLCHTLPPGATVDGVLGLDFFRNKQLRLDFKKGTIELK